SAILFTTGSGTVVNAGTILGAADGGSSSPPGSGILLFGFSGTVINSGTIAGGASGFFVNAGVGVRLNNSGTITNSGFITGGAGRYGYAIAQTSGYIGNTGTIQGGAGSFGIAIQLLNGTISNGAGGLISGFGGIYLGYGSITNVGTVAANSGRGVRLSTGTRSNSGLITTTSTT